MKEIPFENDMYGSCWRSKIEYWEITMRSGMDWGARGIQNENGLEEEYTYKNGQTKLRWLHEGRGRRTGAKSRNQIDKG